MAPKPWRRKARAPAKVKPTIQKKIVDSKPARKCPVSKNAFFEHALHYTFEVLAQPRKFRSGDFGWIWLAQSTIDIDGLKIKVLGDAALTSMTGCCFTVSGSRDKTSGLTEEIFMKEATPLKHRITAKAHEFATGSFGWQAHGEISQTVAGVELTVHYNFHAVVKGSSQKGMTD
mmetsp:Transcript_47880/g.88981  ORF Transcript_47880/g.88981 Transcript_47880/m.88981 type:complete len:174 (+) Transcript_47880:94-615(+)